MTRVLVNIFFGPNTKNVDEPISAKYLEAEYTIVGIPGKVTDKRSAHIKTLNNSDLTDAKWKIHTIQVGINDYLKTKQSKTRSRKKRNTQTIFILTTHKRKNKNFRVEDK